MHHLKLRPRGSSYDRYERNSEKDLSVLGWELQRVPVSFSEISGLFNGKSGENILKEPVFQSDGTLQNMESTDLK